MTPTATDPDPLSPAWNRVQGLALKLVEAVDQLDDAGGIARLAPRLSPKARAGALATLSEARKVLDGPLSALKTASRPGPTPPRPSPPAPVPVPAPSPDFVARRPETRRPGPLGSRLDRKGIRRPATPQSERQGA